VRDSNGHFTVFDPPARQARSASPLTPAAQSPEASLSHTQHGFVENANANIAVFDPANSAGRLSLSIDISGAVTGSFTDARQGYKSRGSVRKAN